MKFFNSLLVFAILSTSALSQGNIIGNLVACYPFKGNANDESGYGHHGVVNGAVLTSDRFGLVNSAYYFNGIQSYIDIGIFSTFTTSDKISLSIWLQPDQVKLQALLFLMPDNFNDRFNAMAYYSHNGVSSTIWDFGNCSGGGRLMQVGTTFSNLWQHWVFTISPVNGMKVYKNGVLNLSQTSSSVLVNRNRNLWIGGGSDASGAPFYFKGKIDDIKIFDREITDSEVVDLYSQEQNCIVTGLADNNAIKDIMHFAFQDSKMVVNIPSGMGNSNFLLYNTNGKLIYSKVNVRGGDSFEVLISDKSMLFYSLKSSLKTMVGKLLPAIIP